jgi:hypothetical protein
VNSLHSVLKTCGSVRISFSRRTPQKVGLLGCLSVHFYFFKEVFTLNFCNYCRQVSDLILKEFSTHPKIYIWDGEGTFANDISIIF